MGRPRVVPGLATVIVPFFNRERFLKKTIASILEQRYPTIELILVDDGSTDDSRSIAESFRDPRIRLLRPGRRRGHPQAINRALPLARGEWIAFFDSDDLMTRNSLKERIDFLKRRPGALAVMGRIGRLIDPSDRPLLPGHPLWGTHRGSLRAARQMARSVGALLPELFVYGDCPLSSQCATLFRHRTVERLGRMDERFPLWGDRDYLLRLTRLQPVPFLDVPVLWYRAHESNWSFRISQGDLVHPKAASMGQRLRNKYWKLALTRSSIEAP